MKVPGLDTTGAVGPLFERFLADSRSRRPEPLAPRERRVDVARTVALVAASAAVALVTDRAPALEIGLALALTLGYAAAGVVRFAVGAGWMVPTQVVFIPMLLLLPPWVVPVAVALGTTLSDVPAVLQRRIHPDRLLIAPASAWYAVGPAFVMAFADLHVRWWDHAAVYLAAFGAQVVSDVTASTLRERLVHGISPRLQVAVLARVYMVDALLTPVGLLAALATVNHGYRSLLVLPLIAVFAVFAQERERHIEHILELSNAYRGTALLLGDVLEDKDPYTATHSQGVVSLSLAVADRMQLDPAARRRVEFAALLHDIGKIAVPAEIINKPGPLDDDEWGVMKLHTVEGQQMLDRVGGVLGDVGRVVRSSHEHYDGSGYPDGLAGADIGVEARIVACCDAFSAMTTTRSYRKAMSVESARDELIRNSGTQFDPQVVDALLKVLRDEECRPSPAASAPAGTVACLSPVS